MALPFAYALGLFVLLAAEDLFFVLPGSGDWAAALPGLLLMALPAALTRASQRVLRRLPALLLRLAAPGTLPACYALLLAQFGWLDLADATAGDSRLLKFCMAALPLFVAELGRCAAETRLMAHPSEGADYRALLRMRIGFVVVFTLPWVMLAAAGDLLERSREAYAAVVATSGGLLFAALAFVAAVSAMLPLFFRAALGLKALPAGPLGDALRATAGALGFRGKALLRLDSGLRSVNAMLVGPLPWPRYLVLTDGLLGVLNVHALRGVVGHEVGHAQAGHPALLLAIFVVAPLLFTAGAQHLPLQELPFAWSAALAAAAALTGLFALRRIAHRFEHEADVLSAIALGGAEPCIQALSNVGEAVMTDAERATLLHPSERQRVDLLRRFAGDASFRARFALRGLRLRRGIAALVVAAMAMGAWGCLRAYPTEAAAWRFLVGDFAGAEAAVRTVGSYVPTSQREWWAEFCQQLECAVAAAGPGGRWEDVRPALAEEGWKRAVRTTLEQGPAAARPWMELATLDAERSPLRRSLLLWCEAAADADLARMELCAQHIVALGPPAELRPVFGGLGPQ